MLRPNLTYDVRKKTSKFMTEIADYVRDHIDDSGIIYWYGTNIFLALSSAF